MNLELHLGCPNEPSSDKMTIHKNKQTNDNKNIAMIIYIHCNSHFKYMKIHILPSPIIIKQYPSITRQHLVRSRPQSKSNFAKLNLLKYQNLFDAKGGIVTNKITMRLRGLNAILFGCLSTVFSNKFHWAILSDHLGFHSYWYYDNYHQYHRAVFK